MRGRRHPSLQKPRNEGGFHRSPKSRRAYDTKWRAACVAPPLHDLVRRDIVGLPENPAKVNSGRTHVHRGVVWSSALSATCTTRHNSHHLQRSWRHSIEQHVCQRSVDREGGCAHPAGRLVRSLCRAGTFASTATSEDRASAASKSWQAVTAPD
jgi:hypothetical protein